MNAANRDLADAYKDDSIELRPDGDPPDSLDEVIARNVKLVHLERMGDNAYWLGLDLKDGRHLRVNFWAGKRSLLKVNAEIEGPASGVGETEREAELYQKWSDKWGSHFEPIKPREVSHLLGKYLNTMVADLGITDKGQYLRDLFSRYEQELCGQARSAGDAPPPREAYCPSCKTIFDLAKDGQTEVVRYHRCGAIARLKEKPCGFAQTADIATKGDSTAKVAEGSEGHLSVPQRIVTVKSAAELEKILNEPEPNVFTPLCGCETGYAEQPVLPQPEGDMFQVTRMNCVKDITEPKEAAPQPEGTCRICGLTEGQHKVARQKCEVSHGFCAEQPAPPAGARESEKWANDYLEYPDDYKPSDWQQSLIAKYGLKIGLGESLLGAMFEAYAAQEREREPMCTCGSHPLAPLYHRDDCPRAKPIMTDDGETRCPGCYRPTRICKCGGKHLEAEVERLRKELATWEGMAKRYHAKRVELERELGEMQDALTRWHDSIAGGGLFASTDVKCRLAALLSRKEKQV